MIYAGIVAGGTGTRMGADIPKQFLEIGGKAILVRTVEKFLTVKEIDRIYTAVHADWYEYTLSLFAELFPHEKRLTVIKGGKDRNSTVWGIVQAIEEENGIGEDDIILTHDGVRPFVTEKIIRDNIQCMKSHSACTTALAAVDTILHSSDGETIGDVPARSEMFLAQTPQSFVINQLKKAYFSLSEEQKSSLTDTCSIFTVQGLAVHIVEGDSGNIKITAPKDLKIAEGLISGIAD